jgi:hypothetical protein
MMKRVVGPDDPMQIQYGGSHYKNMAIQPFQFSLTNGWDSAAHSILKYVSRHRDKGKAEDLLKAIHIVDIRETFWGPHCNPSRPKPMRIPMSKYIIANGIKGLEAHILIWLEEWVENHSLEGHRKMIQQGIQALIEGYGS